MSMLFPLYFLGMLAFGLPWLLHRFSHFEPPVLTFPSKKFLKPSKPPVSNKKKIRYRFLFALRALLLAALCFLFAQPFLNQTTEQALGDTTQIIVVDNSFSMRAGDRWQQAINKAGELINELPQDANAQLFSTNNVLTPLTALTNNHSALSTALNDLTPGFHGVDFGELMTRLNNLANESEIASYAQLVSDVQVSARPVQTNELFATNLTGFRIEPVTDDNVKNVWFTAEARSDDNLFARVNVKLSVANSAGENVSESVTVQVLLEDELVASKTANVGSDASVTLNFDKLDLSTTRNPVFEVRLQQDDALMEDNSQQVPVKGLQPIEVYYVNENNSASPQSEVFIKTALESDRLAELIDAPDANTQVPTQARHAIVRTRLDRNGDLPQWINSAAAQGVNILVIAQRDPSLESRVARQAKHLAQIDLAHPVALSGMNLFKLRFYEAFEFNANKTDTVLIALEDGTPLLIERFNDGGGKVMLLNDPLDGFYSDMPQHPEFVALMQKLITYFEANNALISSTVVGKSFKLPANVQLLNPAGKAMLKLDETANESLVQIDEPGLYSVVSAQSESALQAFTDPRESDVLTMSAESIAAWERRHNDREKADSLQTTALASSNENSTDNDQAKKWLWQWLLPLLALMLFVEPLFANRLLNVSRENA